MGNPDTGSAGRSKLVPFVPGEDPGARHDRRLNANLSRQEDVREWCKVAGVRLTIKNHGHHWRFVRGKQEAEWWPSSAKLVIQRNYDRGIHVHDHLQALARLRKHFPGSPKPPAPPAPRPLRIYVASSWRNEQQPAVIDALRMSGHEVYDFRHPHQTGPSDRGRKGVGFSWSELDPNWQGWTTQQYAAALAEPVARDAFGSDMDALRWCDWCVMVQPCGRSSALELGWAAGAGKLTAVLLAPGEPELMLRMATHLVPSIQDLLAVLRLVDGETHATKP